MKLYLIAALYFSITVSVFATLSVFGLQIMALRHAVNPGKIVAMTFAAGVMIATSVIIVLMLQGTIPVRFVTQSFTKEPTCHASLSAPPRPFAPCARGKTIL